MFRRMSKDEMIREFMCNETEKRYSKLQDDIAAEMGIGNHTLVIDETNNKWGSEVLCTPEILKMLEEDGFIVNGPFDTCMGIVIKIKW